MFFLTAHVRYIKILTWLRGFRVKIAVSIVSKFLKATWAQRKENQIKFRKMARNPQSHVRILIYRTWAIVLFDAFWYVNRLDFQPLFLKWARALARNRQSFLGEDRESGGNSGFSGTCDFVGFFQFKSLLFPSSVDKRWCQ